VFVSQEARIIFVHIWKTGGTSIAAALKANFGPANDVREYGGATRYLPWRRMRNRHVRLGKHAFAIDIRDRLGGDFNSYYSFAFVRNPWDWLVSWYNFVRNTTISPDTGLSWRHHLNLIVGPMDFDQFVRWVTLEDGLLNAEARQQSSFAGRSPVLQRDWVSDLQGNLLVDFVGKFEALETDFSRVAASIGRPELQLQHLNPGKRGSYRDYYSPAAKAAVARYFEPDLDTFGYSF